MNMKVDTALLTPPQAEETRKIQKAAEDFEGLLIAQMLQSIRESALSAWQDKEQDSASSVALEMAESQLARTMAASGGLGIARTLTNSLKDSKP